jgi:O-methyltransferase
MIPRCADYLELLKKCLTASLYEESAWQVIAGPVKREPFWRRPYASVVGAFKRFIVRQARRKSVLLVRRKPFDPEARAVGRDWPCFGYTMIGHKRLDHIQSCVEEILAEGIPGDLIETGVWRGGAVIFMKAILKCHGANERAVWVADSFEGLPPPASGADKQENRDLSDLDYLKASVEEVRSNFARFDLLDENVRFLKGWFRDTLPQAPIERLALLRLDGDLYESTKDALEALYPKVSPGGIVIADDYLSWSGCRQAIDEFRQAHRIKAPLERVDDDAVWWRVCESERLVGLCAQGR